MQSMKEEVKSVIKQVCDNAKIDLSDENSPLLDIGLDSLDYSSVILALEDKFGFEVQGDDMEFMRSINDIVIFLNKKTEQKM